MKGYMYVLKCANEEYYTGSTNNLEKRMEEHNRKEGSNFTWKHIPFELKYHEEFPSIEEAFKREKQIQKWSRKKKEALIAGDIKLLKELSKNHTEFKKNHLRNW